MHVWYIKVFSVIKSDGDVDSYLGGDDDSSVVTTVVPTFVVMFRKVELLDWKFWSKFAVMVNALIRHIVDTLYDYVSVIYKIGQQQYYSKVLDSTTIKIVSGLFIIVTCVITTDLQYYL